MDNFHQPSNLRMSRMRKRGRPSTAQAGQQSRRGRRPRHATMDDILRASSPYVTRGQVPNMPAAFNMQQRGNVQHHYAQQAYYNAPYSRPDPYHQVVADQSHTYITRAQVHEPLHIPTENMDLSPADQVLYPNICVPRTPPRYRVPEQLSELASMTINPSGRYNTRSSTHNVQQEAQHFPQYINRAEQPPPAHCNVPMRSSVPATRPPPPHTLTSRPLPPPSIAPTTYPPFPHTLISRLPPPPSTAPATHPLPPHSLKSRPVPPPSTAPATYPPHPLTSRPPPPPSTAPATRPPPSHPLKSRPPPPSTAPALRDNKNCDTDLLLTNDEAEVIRLTHRKKMEVENLAVTTDDGDVNMTYTVEDTNTRDIVQILQTTSDIIKESFLQMTNLTPASVQGQDPQNNTDSSEVVQTNQPLRNAIDTQYETISSASNDESSNDSNTLPIQEQRLQLQEIQQQRNNEMSPVVQEDYPIPIYNQYFNYRINNQQAPGMLQANQDHNFMPNNGLPNPFMDQFYRYPPPDNRSDYNPWYQQ